VRGRRAGTQAFHDRFFRVRGEAGDAAAILLAPITYFREPIARVWIAHEPVSRPVRSRGRSVMSSLDSTAIGHGMKQNGLRAHSRRAAASDAGLRSLSAHRQG